MAQINDTAPDNNTKPFDMLCGTFDKFSADAFEMDLGSKTDFCKVLISTGLIEVEEDDD